MSVTEKNALMRAKDVTGNSFLIYPVTKAENVEGLDALLLDKADSKDLAEVATSGSWNDLKDRPQGSPVLYDQPQTLTPEQRAMANDNICTRLYDWHTLSAESVPENLRSMLAVQWSPAANTTQVFNYADTDALLAVTGGKLYGTGDVTYDCTAMHQFAYYIRTIPTINEKYPNSISRAVERAIEAYELMASQVENNTRGDPITFAVTLDLYTRCARYTGYARRETNTDGVTHYVSYDEGSRRVGSITWNHDTKTLVSYTLAYPNISSSGKYTSGLAADAATVKADLDNKISIPATGEAGQLLSVKSVDESGKPTEFETVAADYYTEVEIDSKLSEINTAIAGKSESGHNHDDKYATKTELNSASNQVTTYINSELAKKASKDELTTHTSNTTVHITSAERTNWNAAKTHADSAHAPSNAEKNQNAFSNIVVGSTTVAADNATDTLTLAGSNVTITPDATNDKVTIGITKDNVTSALGYTPPTTNTTYSAATTSAAGLMSASDKSKLDGIASGANAYTLPAASSSTLGGVKTGSNITNSSGTISITKANVTAALGYTPPTTNTTYSAATTSAAGLMSASDKSKLDGIASGANAYTLPAASSSTLGGVKTGNNITNSSGTISLTKDNVTAALGYTPPTTNTTYSAATTSAAGLMSASDKSKLDGIAHGANAYTYTLPIAATFTLGGVRIGNNITISSDGIIGITQADVISALGYTPPTGTTASNNGPGLMSAADKNKLDGIAYDATKVIVDDTLSSSSTNPVQNKVINAALDDKMTKENPTGSGSVSINRRSDTVIGYRSTAIGEFTTASDNYSTAIGYYAESSAKYSVAIGYSSASNGQGSVAIGHETTASGSDSVSMGYGATAAGNNSISIGYGTTANGMYSTAMGVYTTANWFQHTTGKYNREVSGPVAFNTQSSNNSDALFLVGYGTTSTDGANAFRVSSGGKCFGTTAFGASGADFAELFEWTDGNPNNEDRRGLFVALDGEKIKIANEGDDYIGVISGAQAFIGNSASEEWQGKYLTDVFGERLTQEIEVPEVVDEETGEIVTPATTATQYVVNPDYDPDRDYTMRENRKEWGIVGLLGQIVMIDDGTCVVGGHVKPSANGIGTASDSGYRVMKRIDENHIKVLVK